MADFVPTDEQAEAVRLAMTGGHLAIHAAAGAGKTKTLELIANAKADKGTFIAFNSSVVKEAKTRFPREVRCVTSHGIAYQSHGAPMRHRMDGARIKSGDIAKRLGIDALNYAGVDGTKRAAPGFLAGYVMQGIRKFCQSSDPEPKWFHIPTPEVMRSSQSLRDSWSQVRHYLEPHLGDAWRDINDRNGHLPYEHDFYRKRWALTEPAVTSDYILLDEGQDSCDCVLGVLEQQRDHAQIIVVGDENQQLYEFAGATDAMTKVKSDHHCTLSTSFRFGDAIAAEANECLMRIGSDMRVVGGGPPGRVGAVEFPDVVLSRTNAAAVSEMFEELDRGGKPHIVGGATDAIGFCRGAQKLIEQGWSDHAELVCFDSWTEVQRYVSEDILGGDLRMLVKLVDEYGAQRILDALVNMPPPSLASVVLSTCHKGKGLEWASVRLADDFPDGNPDKPPPELSELRLLYVAVTRAKTALDCESVGLLRPKARA